EGGVGLQRAGAVGRRRLDAGLGRGGAGLADAVDEVLGAAVAQVVAVHRGDHHVIEAHRGDGLGEVLRLVGVERLGATVADVAEGAAPGADVAHDHEGGRALTEAFVDVRAGGFLAHGVQLVLAQRVLDLVEALGLLAGAELDADPLRLLEAFGGDDLDRDAGGLVGAALLARWGFHGRGSLWVSGWERCSSRSWARDAIMTRRAALRQARRADSRYRFPQCPAMASGVAAAAGAAGGRADIRRPPPRWRRCR